MKQIIREPSVQSQISQEAIQKQQHLPCLRPAAAPTLRTDLGYVINPHVLGGTGAGVTWLQKRTGCLAYLALSESYVHLGPLLVCAGPGGRLSKDCVTVPSPFSPRIVVSLLACSGNSNPVYRTTATCVKEWLEEMKWP